MKPTPEERLERIERAILELARCLEGVNAYAIGIRDITHQTLSPLTDEKENGGN